MGYMTILLVAERVFIITKFEVKNDAIGISMQKWLIGMIWWKNEFIDLNGIIRVKWDKWKYNEFIMIIWEKEGDEMKTSRRYKMIGSILYIVTSMASLFQMGKMASNDEIEAVGWLGIR